METCSLKQHSDSIQQLVALAVVDSEILSGPELLESLCSFFETLHKELAVLNKRISDLESASQQRAT